MKKAISYLYREILLKVWEEIVRKDRYKDYYQHLPKLEEDINSLEVDIQKIVNIDFDEEFCEDLYNKIDDGRFLSDTIADMKSDLMDEGTETGVRDDDYQYPSKELAIPITGLPGYFLGFTYYFGGGKYDNGDWKPDITETCYLLTCREEVKVVKFYLRTADDNGKIVEENEDE